MLLHATTSATEQQQAPAHSSIAASADSSCSPSEASSFLLEALFARPLRTLSSSPLRQTRYRSRRLSLPAQQRRAAAKRSAASAAARPMPSSPSAHSSSAPPASREACTRRRRQSQR